MTTTTTIKNEALANMKAALEETEKQIKDLEAYFAVTCITSTPYCIVMLHDGDQVGGTLTPLGNDQFNFMHTGRPKVEYSKENAEKVAKRLNANVKNNECRIVAMGIYDYNKQALETKRECAAQFREWLNR